MNQLLMLLLASSNNRSGELGHSIVGFGSQGFLVLHMDICNAARQGYISLIAE